MWSKKTYKRKEKAKHPFEKLKSIDGSSIPPSETELAPHIDGSAFVARLWGSAHHQDLDNTLTSVWENVDSEFRIIWFNGEQMPPALISEIQAKTEVSDAQGDGGGTGDDVEEDHDPLPREMESSDEDTDDERA